MELNFNELYSATTADLKAQDAELVKRSNKRALEAAIDSAKKQELDAQSKLNSELRVVQDGKDINFSKVMELQNVINSAQSTVVELEQFAETFFTDVEPVVKKK